MFLKKVLKVVLVFCLISSLLSLFACSSTKTTESEKNEVTATETSETYVEEPTDSEAETEAKVVHEIVTPMNFVSVIPYRETNKTTYVELEFSKEIDDRFDGQAYISFEPSVEFTVSKVGKKLVVRGDFNSTSIYKVTILKGIRGKDGTATSEDYTENIYFEQKKPKVMFTNEGIILPSVNEKKIYIRSLNVKKANIVVRKVYANNTTQFLQNFDFTGNGNYKTNNYYYYGYDDENEQNNDEFFNVGDELYNFDFDIENEIDTWVQTAIDLSTVIDSNGIYQVSVKFDEHGTSYKFRTYDEGELYYDDWRYLRENGNIQKTILLTDVGILAQKNDDGYRVNILDIVENRPIRSVKTYLMSKNNQILEEKTTDADGIVNFSNHKNAFYIYADNTLSKSILVLKNTLNTNGFAVDGAYATDGIKGFVYTERGVYRPGDPIHLAIIARNNDKELDDKQPVKITVYDPTGAKMIENDVIKGGKNGFYTYNFKTETSSRTGIWKLEATIGDEVFKKDISVEAVVPNRIRVNLNIPDVVKFDEEIKDWTLNANYLFGEPAGELDYGVSFDIKEEPVNFEKYKEYSFTEPSSYGYYTSKYLNGTLNKNGYSDIVPDFSSVKFKSLNMLVDVAGRVTQDGGRNVITKKYVKLKKFDTYIGIENTSSYKKPGSNIDLKVICVTEDGEKLVAGKNLKYRIYGNDYYWWWDYSNYNDFVRSFKSDKNTKLIKEGNLLTSDVPTLINDEVPNDEYIYLEIEDETTGQITGVNLQSSEWVDPSVTKKIETLNVSADRKKYNVGDVAKIRFKGSNSSKAIITIEKGGKILDQYYKDVNDGEVIEDLKITKEMAPNVYAYVTLLQDYKTKENDRPLRLYGILPIIVEDEDTKIDLQIDAPEQIRPNEKFTVKVKNRKNKQFDFTIAVVDEGLLDITAFKTPSPWEHFFQKLAAKLSLYDNYSEIIDRPYGAIHQILKVGGDEALLDEMARRRRLKELGLEEADRFTPVSLFKGVLTSDNIGEASVEFEMPNYMGQVRIMVVAANGNSYGSLDKDMIVKAPIIIEPTIPRSLKVGDKLSIPISVFALEEGIGKMQVYYTFKGKTQTKDLNLARGDKEIVYFDEEIGNEVSSESLTVGVKSNAYNYEETVGIAINSNRAAVELSENKEINGRNEVTFTNKNEYMKGTFDGVLTVSNELMLGLDKRLKFLIQYPYGCVEQTTSSVFPQLYIDKLSTAKNYDKSKIVNNINAGIERLKLFQLSNGSFSYWPSGTTTKDWATNYVGHFLIEAKKNGYYVPDSMYNNWVDYTSKAVRGTNIRTEQDIDLKCYALYLLALAGKQNVSEMNYMFENYFNKNMNLTSKMYLAAAYKLIGEDKIAVNISNAIDSDAIKKMYEEIIKKDVRYYNYSYGSELRELAAYLNCYTIIYGTKEQKTFDEILSAMRSQYWHSTQTTAYCLMALSNVISSNISETIKGTIEMDGVKTEYSTKNQFRMNIDSNVKNIKVTSSTDAMTYVNYYVEGVPVSGEVEDYSEGFSIERNYYNDEGKSIDASSTKSGETFWLEVVVKPTKKYMDDLENIALTQVLPTGWEIENLRVNNASSPKWVEDKEATTEVTYTDIRDDRVMWFFDYTTNKEYRFLVKINAVTKGEYDFPGTKLEAMYDNDYRAYKKGKKVKVN
ncbi:MAG: alpha-2-macroglobulin family protein [Lachnospiraceae bacterium]|nr:alpha-2-macroglobulin family protein [Lachnospiraceae bacterium]